MFDGEIRELTLTVVDTPRRKPIPLGVFPRGTRAERVWLMRPTSDGLYEGFVLDPEKVRRSRKKVPGANLALTLPVRVRYGDVLAVTLRLPPTLPGGYTQASVKVHRFARFAENAQESGNAEYRLEEVDR